jgi:hypothetical protein
MSPAWVRRSRRVEELALPKSFEGGNRGVNKDVLSGIQFLTVANGVC